MSKKVLILSSSPRKGWNTAKMLEAAKALGRSVR